VPRFRFAAAAAITGLILMFAYYAMPSLMAAAFFRYCCHMPLSLFSRLSLPSFRWHDFFARFRLLLPQRYAMPRH
jgi:hypothetical protein